MGVSVLLGMKKKTRDGWKVGREHQGSLWGPLASKLVMQLGGLSSH